MHQLCAKCLANSRMMLPASNMNLLISHARCWANLSHTSTAWEPTCTCLQWNGVIGFGMQSGCIRPLHWLKRDRRRQFSFERWVCRIVATSLSVAHDVFEYCSPSHSFTQIHVVKPHMVLLHVDIVMAACAFRETQILLSMLCISSVYGASPVRYE